MTCHLSLLGSGGPIGLWSPLFFAVQVERKAAVRNFEAIAHGEQCILVW